MTYLDHNATSPVRPEVAEAMARALRDLPGNPSSVHAAGRRARQAVEEAREEVARFLGARRDEVTFTSGGTEGDQLAIRGLGSLAAAGGRRHVVTSPLEHPAVRGAVRALEEGWGPAGAGAGRVTLVPVSARGEIVPADLEAVLRDDTGLVTLALANHELGNVYPMAALGRAARRRGALVHTDAVQAAGKVRLDMVSMEADAATISAHKIGGPKGVGAVFVRKELDLPPLWQGGHQERERRPGTENLTGIVGFGVACRSAGAALDGERERLSALRDALERGLLEVPGARILGITEVGGRLPGTTCVAFAGAPGQLVAIGLDLEGICVSTGAACTSGAIRPSPVLEALGQAPAEAGEALRLSLGWTTTAADVARVCAVVPRVVARVRAAQALPAATAAAHAGGAA